jgi:hypothetical protein
VPARHVASGAVNATKTCGQSDYRTVPPQRRPTACTKYVAIVRSGPTTLGSRAATVPSDPTAWRGVEHASNVARRDNIHVIEDIIRLP